MCITDKFFTYEELSNHPALDRKEKKDLFNSILHVKGAPQNTPEQNANVQKAWEKIHAWEGTKQKEAKSRQYTPLTTDEQKVQKIIPAHNLYGQLNKTCPGLITPKRRLCGFGGTPSSLTISAAKTTVFIKDDEIIKVHPMYILDSPLFKKTPDALGITESGRHVILQQAIKSCVPTCVGMLVLDHKKDPDWDAICTTRLATREQAVTWIEKAGLKSEITILDDLKTLTKTLTQLIEKNGSGVLGISPPTLGGHVIVLDEICEKTRTAVIRESFHGWALTIQLDPLLSWIKSGDYFLQIPSTK